MLETWEMCEAYMKGASVIITGRMDGRDVASVSKHLLQNWCENRVVMPYAAQQSELYLTAPFG